MKVACKAKSEAGIFPSPPLCLAWPGTLELHDLHTEIQAEIVIYGALARISVAKLHLFLLRQRDFDLV